MTAVIVNLRHRNAEVRCDRSSFSLGNPFLIGRDGDRNEVCDKYEEYFSQRVKTDEVFLQRILALRGKKLGCWCRCDPPCNHPKCKKQLRCHVQTIVKFLEKNL
jgi:hypothetical protein